MDLRLVSPAACTATNAHLRIPKHCAMLAGHLSRLPPLDSASYVIVRAHGREIPLFQSDPGAVYPPSRTTLGASLIATGQSGADNFMAYCVYDFCTTRSENRFFIHSSDLTWCEAF
jgi:hypothetical protein